MLRRFSLFFLLFSVSMYGQGLKYQLGQGVQFGNLPLYMGGYFSLEYSQFQGGPRTLTLDELALMLYGETDTFSYLMEVEADNVYSEVFGDEASDVKQEDFHIERMYVNKEFNEHYALMLGKYNSPIGFWNRIPINVLRDTSSNPVLTHILFPNFTTGADLHYQSGNSYDAAFDLMLQGTEDLDKLFYDDPYNNFDIDAQAGAGLSFRKDAVKYQFNAGYFHLVSDEEYYYLLGAFQYETEAFKVQASLGTQFNGDGSTVPYVGYVQGSYLIQEEHEAILRVEAYDDRLQHTKDSFVVMGYTYRPLFPVAFKAEYQWHSKEDENRFLLSVSALF